MILFYSRKETLILFSIFLVLLSVMYFNANNFKNLDLSIANNKVKVAIIIPFKNRHNHLKCLLTYIKENLQKYNSQSIFVIEQLDRSQFNKGLIMNIAFDYIVRNLSYNQYNCYIFHDVDLIPQNDATLSCHNKHPVHMSTYIDEMRYNLMYNSLVGGVLAFTPQQFIKVNGFSNFYEGWGAEDDDMFNRILDSGMKIAHASDKSGNYHMIRHAKREKTIHRKIVLALWRRWRYDGINMLSNPMAFHHYYKHMNFKIKRLFLKFCKSSYKIIINGTNPLYANISITFT